MPGKGVGVPVVNASAVANKAIAWAVAALMGVGVDVTTIGVTQLSGNGVGVPTFRNQAVAIAAWVAAANTESGEGVAVIKT